MKEVVVKVTAEDIKHGVPCVMSQCPVSLATYRALRDAGSSPRLVRTGPSYIAIHYGDSDLIPSPLLIGTPEKVARFISQFDRLASSAVTSGVFGPFEFAISLPDRSGMEAR